MRLLRLPLKERDDVRVYAFPGDGSIDPDKCAANIAAEMRAVVYTGFFLPTKPERRAPVVRVVPLSEEDVYAQAGDDPCERIKR